MENDNHPVTLESVIYVILLRPGVRPRSTNMRTFTEKQTQAEMNLVRQFPDISEKMRSKNETGGRSSRSANAKQSRGYWEDDAVVKYYEGQFRRWHLQFLFILAATLGVTYIIILNSFWIYNLIDKGQLLLLSMS